MVDTTYASILAQGVDAWNQWRAENTDKKPELRHVSIRDMDLSNINFRNTDLTGADLSGLNLRAADFRDACLKEATLSGADLTSADFTTSEESYGGVHVSAERGARYVDRPSTGANLKMANFSKAILSHAQLSGANLQGAILQDAQLIGASLYRAELINADLRGTDLSTADLRQALLIGARITPSISIHYHRLKGGEPTVMETRVPSKLCDANLEGADLRHSTLVEADLSGARLTNCSIYGISAWKLQLEGAVQLNLLITPPDEPAIRVDNIEVGQFIYLLLSNDRIRHVIDTITSKVVLILGRFSAERKAVLDAIREELRRSNFIPILFDFDKPASKDVTGTIETLARMARFIIADLTHPSSIPHEMATLVPFLRTTPVLPIRLAGTGGYSMFDDYQRAYPWVLNTHQYKDSQSLISALPEIIAPANEMAGKLRIQ